MKIRKPFLFTTFILSLFLFFGTFGFGIGIDTNPFWGYIANVSAEQEGVNVINYAVKEGDTFSTVLEKFGFSSEEVNQILAQAEDIYDFTSITAGNIFQTVLNEDNIAELRYDKGIEDQVVIRSTEEGFDIYEDKIIYDIKIETASGEVNRSLFLDGRDAGLHDKTILELAEIFSWDVDFSTDIREGDEFSVVYRNLYRDGFFVGPGRIIAGKFINQGSEYYAFYFENGDEIGNYFNLEGQSVVKQFLKSPLDFARISSGFSYNRLDPVTRSSYGAHRAIDYAAPSGTPIRATGDGRVTFAGWGSPNGLGRYIKISHGGVYDTVYAHLSGFASGVSTGVSVRQGQIIGYVGATGYATGPHLHYEMHKYGSHVNPLTEDVPPGDPIKEEYRGDFEELIAEYKPILDN